MPDDNTTKPVQDAEVLTRELNEPEADAYASFSENDENDTENNAVAIASLENLIRQRLEVIEKTQEEVSELRTRLNDMLQNSREYVEADEVAKEANKKKRHVKNTIMQTQEAQQLNSQLTEAKDFQKDNIMTLNDMLIEFYETMRIKEIDDVNGHPRDLEIKVKVAPLKRFK